MEPSSVAAIEAANYALPVVATQTGGFFDSVEDQITGLLVPPKNVDALAAALARLLENPDEAMKMGEAGRGRVANRFNWDVVGDSLAAIVRRAAKL
jgi:glycosyltransferase involved in cell wall biosynthesis